MDSFSFLEESGEEIANFMSIHTDKCVCVFAQVCIWKSRRTATRACVRISALMRWVDVTIWFLIESKNKSNWLRSTMCQGELKMLCPIASSQSWNVQKEKKNSNAKENSNAKNGVRDLGSNFDLICCIHFRANALGEALNSSLFSHPQT